MVAANASPPSVAITVGAPLKGTVSTAISFTLTNPASNQYALTGFTLIAPAGWTVTACSAGAPWGAPTLVGNSCQYGGGTLNPGSTALTMGITVTAPAPSGSGTYPYSGTFTSTVQDGSGAAFYGGPSFALQVMSSTTVITPANLVVTPGGSNPACAATCAYSAGTAPYTITAKVTCTPGAGCPASGIEAGLPIVWSATGYAAGTAYSFTPPSGTTDGTGKSTTTFQPSNSAAAGSNSATVTATIGTSSVSQTTVSIVTSAGAPSTITFGAPFAATHYITTYGTPSTSSGNWACIGTAAFCNLATGPITASIADQFGNPIDLSTLGPYTVTISAVAAGGLFDAGAGTHPTSISCGAALTCPIIAGSFTLTVNYPYFQSGTFGSSGLLTAGATSTAPSFAAAGSSGSLITSTFAVAMPTPVVTGAATPATCAAAVPPAPNPCQVAGKTVNITLTLTPATAQAGVPVTFYVDLVTSSAGYAGTFASSAQKTTTTTSTGGVAFAIFSVDTTAGATVFFNANAPRPTDATPSAVLANSSDTAAAVTTIAGAASKMKVNVYFTNSVPPCPVVVPAFTLCNKVGSSSVGGLTLWINALFSDAFNNAAVNPGPNAVQVTLATAPAGTSGVLSATTVYIPAGGKDTYSSFGPIAWTLPSGTGLSLTLTASGVVSGIQVSGSKTITTVSPNPTLAITSPTPTAGVVYSKSTGVVFSGNANVSTGYPPTVTFGPGSITFSVDKGAATAATIVTGSGTSMVTWSAGVFFSVGLHNITFTATDSKGNSVTSATWQVLVDTSAPTIKFTTATGATLTYGASVNATIFDNLGDLNMTSIKAWFNGTAVSSANLVVTGTQTLGKNSSASVAIKNLPAGTWVVTLAASDLAGNSNPGVSITVTVQVSFANSVVINSAAYTTLGSFSGILVSATNIWSSPQNLLVFAVWKNAAGQTVAVTSGGLPSPMAAGATGSAFAPLPAPLASGTYTVSVFVITTNNNPVSASTSISVTV